MPLSRPGSGARDAVRPAHRHPLPIAGAKRLCRVTSYSLDPIDRLLHRSLLGIGHDLTEIPPARPQSISRASSTMGRFPASARCRRKASEPRADDDDVGLGIAFQRRIDGSLRSAGAIDVRHSGAIGEWRKHPLTVSPAGAGSSLMRRRPTCRRAGRRRCRRSVPYRPGS